MTWQHWRVLGARTVHTSDDTIFRVKLPASNILHSLLVACECTVGTTNHQGNGLTDVVDWIKVIGNGSQVLFYLEPETIKAQHLLDTGKGIDEDQDEQGSAVQKASYPIKFGREWFDPKYYLPLARFNDLELQIKYSPTIAVTGFATGTFTTTVLGLMSMDGVPGPYRGSLVTRIIENFTTVATGDKVIEPPQRWPYRGLFVRCREAAIEDGVDITNVKFDLNDEQRTLLNMSWNQLHDLNQSINPVIATLRKIIHRADADTVDTLVSRIRAAALTVHADVSIAADTFDIARIDTIAGGRLTLNISTGDLTAGAEDLTAQTTDGPLFLLCEGDGIPFVVFVPVNAQDDEPWFDSAEWDQVKLTLTQSAADGDVDVVLQEVQQFVT